MHAAPAKRHHSQISTPITPTSSRTNYTSNSSTSQSTISNSTTNHNGHQQHQQQQQHRPFENFMHMFGSFHRPSSRRSRQQPEQQQQQQQQQTQQEARPANNKPSTAITSLHERALNRHHQNKLARQGQPSATSSSNTNSSTTMNSTYEPPTVHRTTAPSATVSTGSSKPSSQLKPHLLVTASSTISASSSSTAATSGTQHSRSKPNNPSAAASWRTALCPRSNKHYYWNVHTRESRWKKPLELASEEEKEELRSKERKLKEFFESMERNIINKLERGRERRDAHAAQAGRRAAVQAAKDAVVVTVGGHVHSSGHSGAGADASISSPGNTNVTVNATTSSGSTQMAIDQAWLQGTSLSSPSETANDDWISGWITPGSDASSSLGRASPTGSLSSMEFSVATPGSDAGCFGAGSYSRSNSSCREERDDTVLPLSKPGRIERIKSSSKKPIVDKPNLIRTISKMEYDLAHQLNPNLKSRMEDALAVRNAANASANLGSPGAEGTVGREREPLTPTTQTCDIFSSLRLTLGSEGLDVFFDAATGSNGAAPVTPTSPMTPNETRSLSDDVPMRSLSSPASTDGTAREGVAKPNLTKRNTCGTIYLGSTLSAPDKDALIKCVCGVFRAHLLQNESNAKNNSVPMLEDRYEKEEKEKLYETFCDRRAPGDYRSLDTASTPSLAQITDFYRSIFLRSQMEVDCIIISLIYVERLLKKTNGGLTPRSTNWRSILFSCMVMASKVWDDLSMWNCDFSKIGPSGMTFSLGRTNELEVALLRALEYKVKVNASEYAKYYFLLRGMLSRSGLANDDLARLTRPMDFKGAQTLDKAGGTGSGGTCTDGTGTGEKTTVKKGSLKDRSKSYGGMGNSAISAEVSPGTFRDDGSGGGALNAPQSSPMSNRVSLEQIVRM